MVLRGQKVQPLQIDHIDLMEVAPLKASLKIYGGRLHVPKMQELPFHPDLVLTPDQITCVRWYCINSDLTATAFLYMELEPQIKLREQMSVKYGIDLRSKSDAQIAEAVINTEYRRLTGVDARERRLRLGRATVIGCQTTCGFRLLSFKRCWIPYATLISSSASQVPR